jgi:hypothetical protein
MKASEGLGLDEAAGEVEAGRSLDMTAGVMAISPGLWVPRIGAAEAEVRAARQHWQELLRALEPRLGARSVHELYEAAAALEAALGTALAARLVANARWLVRGRDHVGGAP